MTTIDIQTRRIDRPDYAEWIDENRRRPRERQSYETDDLAAIKDEQVKTQCPHLDFCGAIKASPGGDGYAGYREFTSFESIHAHLFKKGFLLIPFWTGHSALTVVRLKDLERDWNSWRDRYGFQS